MDNLDKQKEVDDLFLKAVAKGNKNDVDQLLNIGVDGVRANINALTPKKNNPLFVAFIKNDFDMFEHLLKKGVNPNFANTGGVTVLMEIVKTTQIKYLEKLLEYKTSNGLDLNQGTPDHNITALHYACMFEQIDSANLLIDAGADINVKTIQKATPILISAQEGCLPLVEKLVQNGANLGDVDFFGKDVLINAIYTSGSKWLSQSQKEQGNMDLANFILDNGADATYVAPGGLNSLFAATLMGKEDLAIRLLEEGANAEHIHNYADLDTTPANLAFSSGLVRLAELMIDKGVDLTVKDSRGNTAFAYGFMNPTFREKLLNIPNFNANDGLYNDGANNLDGFLSLSALAVSGADYDSFEKLLDNGAKIDTKSKRFNPFKIALQLALPQFVERMLSDSSLNVKLNELWTTIDDAGNEAKIFPLRILAENKNAGKIDAVLFQKKLIEKTIKQAESNKQNNIAQKINDQELEGLKKELEQFNTLEEDIQNNKNKIFDLFIANGVNVNFADDKNRTALFYTSNAEFTKSLIDHGADLLFKDCEGNIPLAWAIKNNRNEVADCLLESLIDKNLVDDIAVKTILIDMIYTAPSSPMAASLFAEGIKNTFNIGSPQINYQDEDGNSPLIVSAATGQGSVAKILIDLGADVNLKNNDGEIALFHAIADQNPTLVEFLISKGSDLNHKSNSGMNALDIAIQVGHKEIINVIEKALNPDEEIEEVVLKIKPKL